MATTYQTFTGTCKWAKVYEPDEKYNVYSINLYLDEANVRRLKATGCQLTVKEDSDGQYVVFRRPVAKLIKGELVKFDAPKVEVKDGDSYVPFTKNIGNGSKVTCNVSFYDTIKGKGHTLLGVTVRDHVEYNK